VASVIAVVVDVAVAVSPRIAVSFSSTIVVRAITVLILILILVLITVRVPILIVDLIRRDCDRLALAATKLPDHAVHRQTDIDIRPESFRIAISMGSFRLGLPFGL